MFYENSYTVTAFFFLYLLISIAGALLSNSYLFWLGLGLIFTVFTDTFLSKLIPLRK